MNPTPLNLDSKTPPICPYCGQKIIQAGGVTPGHSGTLRKGGLFVCASCGQASIVGDSNLELLTKEKFDLLPTNVKQALGAIQGTLQDMSVKQSDLN